MWKEEARNIGEKAGKKSRGREDSRRISTRRFWKWKKVFGKEELERMPTRKP